MKKLRITYDCLLVFVDHNAVPLDFFIVTRDVWHVNRNVSVRLLKRGINLVRKLGDVVLDLALGLKCGQVHLLDDSLQVFETILRLFLIGLHHVLICCKLACLVYLLLVAFVCAQASGIS